MITLQEHGTQCEGKLVKRSRTLIVSMTLTCSCEEKWQAVVNTVEDRQTQKIIIY